VREGEREDERESDRLTEKVISCDKGLTVRRVRSGHLDKDKAIFHDAPTFSPTTLSLTPLKENATPIITTRSLSQL
jgi:hypothetical protein